MAIFKLRDLPFGKGPPHRSPTSYISLAEQRFFLSFPIFLLTLFALFSLSLSLAFPFSLSRANTRSVHLEGPRTHVALRNLYRAGVTTPTRVYYRSFGKQTHSAEITRFSFGTQTIFMVLLCRECTARTF